MPAPSERSRNRFFAARRRLNLERLEDRFAPANLTLTSIELVDGFHQPIAAPVLGQQVLLRATVTSDGLTGSEEYIVRFTVDGISLDSATLTSTTGSFTLTQATIFASEGLKTATVTVDATNAVEEDNEDDNTLTLEFTPVAPDTLPSKFVFPVTGTPNVDFAINNYVDVDPRPGQRADYRGGPFQNDGHDAWDINAVDFSAQDAGVPIVAAAGGIVVQVVDGNFDRETTTTNRPANLVVIDHGNGWRTTYLHLAANSIVVQVGQEVQQGQLLGLMGSSGNSTAPHLHWGVFYRGAAVETGLALQDYWISPPVYQGDAPPTVMKSGISNYNPTSELGEGPSDVRVFPTAQNWSVFYWYHVSNYRANSQVQVVWYRPDGTVFTTSSHEPNFQQPSRWQWTIGTNWKSMTGTWQVALFVDGTEIDRQAFEVVASGGTPEIALRQGSTYIVDNRITPLNFGSVAAGGTAITRTFIISNLGSVPLTLNNLQLPTGFSLASIFPQALGANSSATFDLRLDTAVIGFKFGEVRVTTNDSDEPLFSFLIQGTVTGTPPTGTPVLTLSNVAVAYGHGKAPVVIDGNADLADSDATTWNNTTLRVAVLANASSFDRLAIRNQGVLEGQVGVSGNSVTFGGVVVGTFSGGQGSTPLVLNFGPNATFTAVRAVLRNLTYANLSNTPDTRPRFLGLTFTDSTGRTSNLVVRRVSSTPVPLNDAPVLNPALVGHFPEIDEDEVPAGTSVATLLANSVTDRDRLQAIGLAVLGTTGTFGQWQYSLDAGASWQLIGNVSAESALLLGPDALIRFVPLPDENGTATISYRAWDGTTGTEGARVDLSEVVGGGTSAFSQATATSNAVVHPVNDPPTFTPGPDIFVEKNSPLQTFPGWATAISPGPDNESHQTVEFLVTVDQPELFVVLPSLTPTGTLTFQSAFNAVGVVEVTVVLRDSEGAMSEPVTFQITIIPVNAAPVLTPFEFELTSTAPFTVASLLGDNVSDPDDDAVEGIAIVSVSRTSGDWQYSLDGGITWLTLSTASLAKARLLRATDLLRFTPDLPNAGFGVMHFHAWDQTLGVAGGTADLSGPGATGGKTPFSVASASVSIFLGKGVLGLDEDPAFISGGFVAQLLRSDVVDIDVGAVQGVALVGGTQGAEGHWEFSLDGATTWQPTGPFSSEKALLLRASDAIRFVPAPNWHGFFQLIYHAWDQTSGVPGGFADLSKPGATGGHTSFSVETLSYKDVVLPVNDRPELAPGHVNLPTVPVGTVNPVGLPLSLILQDRTFDVDGDPVGLAITQADGPGTWQFSLDGGTTWEAVGEVSNQAARVLPPEALIRFVPGAGYIITSKATLTYRGWDGTEGQAGGLINVNTTLSVSLDEGTASLGPNTRPTLAIAPLLTIAPNRPFTVAELLGNAVTDPDPNSLQGIAVVGVSGAGSWQYSLDGGQTWEPLVALTATSARLFRPQDLLRYLPKNNVAQGRLVYRAWDQTHGTAGQLDNPLAEGVTAYSDEVQVAVVNAAPVLNFRRVRHFPPRNQGAGPGLGVQVRQLLADAVRDNGVVDPRGIAIVTANPPEGGRWEVSFDNGQTWEELGAVSVTQARLLRLLDRIRFVAPPSFAGSVFLIYHAWDQSSGTAGQFADLSTVGGSTPFSATRANARLNIVGAPVPINNRPTIDTSIPVQLPSIGPGQVTLGDPAQLLLVGASDPDPGTILGVAVIATSTEGGVWQYSLDGGARWQNVGVVTPGMGLLLRPGDRLRFRPDPGFAGIVQLAFRAWDRTDGLPGQKVPTGGMAFSVEPMMATLAVNTAPVLDTTPTPTLPNILEDETDPEGATIASLLGTAVTDPDPGALLGAAIVGTTGQGTWEYSLDGGLNWLAIGSRSLGSALLLGATDMVRFVPAPNFFGQASIRYHAWDQTRHRVGDIVALTLLGGSSPFSLDEETARVTILPVNDRPVLSPVVATILTPMRPGTTTFPVNSVSALLDGIVSDPDPGTQFGVAIIGQTGGTTGAWQYSLDGGLNWLTMGNLTPNAALLLRATDLIRYVPNPNFHGRATLTYLAWDRTQGQAGQLFNTLGPAADAFSLEQNVAYVPVNHAPELRV